MNWQEYISLNPQVMTGKPVIKGTRITVELILERLGNGWTTEQLLESYPHLSADSIRACLLYAVDSVKNEIIHDIAA
ncbi:DUF433 domain-containing protein [Dyadobacter sp. CY312]|uniref:DUF433 domain-containing protein n=1 Tax=Dyadobacter sp. CY312 TaxID=2907303 RepID=UPI001F389792|nr:DUF433 domain-containing protein [Dyadobacter sp. CY312]MCE7042996.1 DUF433 domain-containing protein [Dyadobacter sp. CY312]